MTYEEIHTFKIRNKRDGVAHIQPNWMDKRNFIAHINKLCAIIF